MRLEKSTKLNALKTNLTTKFKLAKKLPSLILVQRCTGACKTPFKKDEID